MATNYQKYTCVETGDGSLVAIHITNFTYNSHYQIYTHAELVIKTGDTTRQNVETFRHHHYQKLTIMGTGDRPAA